MRMRSKPQPILMLAALLTLSGLQTGVGAQQVYRSVDPQGNIIYSDKPPANAAQTQSIELLPGPGAEQVKQERQRTREIQESADKMAKDREAREKIAAEERRQQQERERAAEQEARLARLEAMERNRDYWDYGSYYPRYPHRPIIEHPIARPRIQPKPGLPPVQGLDGTPLLKTHIRGVGWR